MEALTDYEIREDLISQLPDLTAAFIAENGPIETLPILTEREVTFQFRVHTMKRAVPKEPRKRGRKPGLIGPKPENIEKIRPLMSLGLNRKEMMRRSGLSYPTVRTIAELLSNEPT